MRYGKKVLSLILLLTLFVSSAVNVMAAENTIEQKRDYLNQIGLSEQIISNMSNEMIERWYEKTYGKNAYFLEEQTTIYEIDNSENGTDGIAAISNIPADELSLTTYYCNYINELGYVDSVDVGVFAEWLTVPYFQKTDAITVNWDNSIFSFLGMGTYVNNRVGDTWYEVLVTGRPDVTNQGGFGVSFPLKKQNMYQSGYPSIEVLMTLEPAVVNSISPSSPIRPNIHVNYAHSTVAMTPSVGFSTSGASVGFSISTAYDEASTSIVYNPSKENITDW